MSDENEPITNSYLVTSGYGANSKEPFVEIEAPKLRVQMTPENARDLALNLLQAVEAAYTDAFMIEFSIHALGVGDRAAVMLLQEFRQWREQKQSW